MQDLIGLWSGGILLSESQVEREQGPTALSRMHVLLFPSLSSVAPALLLRDARRLLISDMPSDPALILLISHHFISRPTGWGRRISLRFSK
ncbi:hypothetical protein CgunFtcFv8_020164 [Champsocephalus gunnari]|uniref:Uncharacterized protein n=1 Tax=Champsocephalus gunnari TaxID=52237 RepID=A0AAN8HPC9_CHAGU|nr:hypothetical protein CgunFtcFv8_020164 [Champsocephalus gunnari]